MSNVGIASEEYVFIDRRRNPFSLIDKLVIFKWLPFIGAVGFSIYSIYVALTNKDQGYAFPSLKKLSKFLEKDKKTVIKYNRLLEQYGLVTIERLQSKTAGFISNRYYINEVPDLPPDLSPKYEQVKLIDKDPFTNTASKQAAMEQPKTTTSSKKPGGASGMIPLGSGIIPPPLVESFHPKETNIKETKLSLSGASAGGESDLQIPKDSIFSKISPTALKKLSAAYTANNVRQAIQHIDRIYRGRRKDVVSPIALLKSVLKEGIELFVGVDENKQAVSQPPLLGSQHETQSKEWEEILKKNRSLPQNVLLSWEQMTNTIKKKVKPHVFETWFQPLIPIELKDGSLILYSLTSGVADYITRNHQQLIEDIVKEKNCAFQSLRFYF